jgi:hypothetical protein
VNEGLEYSFSLDWKATLFAKFNRDWCHALHCNLSANKGRLGAYFPNVVSRLLHYTHHKICVGVTRKRYVNTIPSSGKTWSVLERGGAWHRAKKRYMTNKFLSKGTPFRPKPGPLATRGRVVNLACTAILASAARTNTSRLKKFKTTLK